jgi:hypothetical protein
MKFPTDKLPIISFKRLTEILAPPLAQIYRLNALILNRTKETQPYLELRNGQCTHEELLAILNQNEIYPILICMISGKEDYGWFVVEFPSFVPPNFPIVYQPRSA